MRNSIVRSPLVCLILIFGLVFAPLPVSAYTPSAGSLSHSASSGTLAINQTTPQTAQAASRSSFQVQEAAGGLAISWHLGAATDSVQAAAVLDTLETVRYNGYDLPMQVQTVLLPDGATPQIQVQSAATATWHGTLREGAPLIPTVIDWESYGPLVEEMQLPTAPIFVMQRGRVRGQDVAVVAISPLYQERAAGAVQLASDLQAFIPGARPLHGGLSQLLHEQSARAANLSADDTVVAAPRNAAAAKSAAKIYVVQPGMQKLLGQDLIDLGGVPAGVDIKKLHLMHDGTPIALERRDNNNDGKLDGSDEFRFYAAPLTNANQTGDFWNPHDIYWLTLEATDGLSMRGRSATPGTAPVRDVGTEQGVWESNSRYESRAGGADGDHWFAKCLKDAETDPEQECYPHYSLTLNNVLPLAPSSGTTSLITLTGTSLTVAKHQLTVTFGSKSETLSWFNRVLYNGWEEGFATTARPQQLALSLKSSELPSGLLFDKVYWQQPVLLNLRGKGATFWGAVGEWRYKLTNRPAGSTLYDITDPREPHLLLFPTQEGTVHFQDKAATPHHYILAATGTLHSPAIAAHSPVVFNASDGADALYIAPAEFHAGLEPLVNLRRAQGYKVRVLDVQQIYDTWSFGRVSPDAIRDMLRNAVSSWTPKPIAFTLVGDGTHDPRNYLGRLNENHNRNLIPPYLADHVDPWLKQTACEVCFAQLDDDRPLGGVTDPGGLIDIWGGRLSVQDQEQLATMVNKIVSYETAPDRHDPAATWRQTSVFVTDDYYNSSGTPDLAGNFPAFSDEIIAHWQSPRMIAQRMYYDPDPKRRGGSAPWRIRDANLAHDTAVELFNRGPAFFNTQGHSNHFFFASTVIGDPNVTDNWLFSTLDVGKLTNIDRLSIVMQMTCYTSQFMQVSRTGTTLDENLMRHPGGGAVAVWGPAGLTVALGHDTMQQGFYKALAAKPALTAKMGELIEAGYFKLFEKGGCCQDARKTYLLQGDPLMTVMVSSNTYSYMPSVTNMQPASR